ncbi:MAG: hypothetical protein KAS72_08325 [Phycisphaerales bacterium]|nr:hypothetical protein [Phycisphaerales bacterium]
MGWLLDIVYCAAAVATAPVWLPRMVATGKHHTDWAGRFGRLDPLPDKDRPRILLHGVSVGEVNALRTVVPLLDDQFDVVIATTTNTGYDRAVNVFGANHTVVRYPFDFSGAVSRFLDAVKPDTVGLVELELWPNFMRACERRSVPVAVINGRLSARSFRNYHRFRRLLRGMFRRLAACAVQDADYAQRFLAMGVSDDVVEITGSMKWDNAVVSDHVDGADELAAALGIDRDRPLVVAGSTAPDETELIDRAIPDGAQLLIAPRKPEHFDQAARELGGPVRRSAPSGTGRADRFLLDTIGELRAAYSLADLAIVGRSFGDLFGSDMTEPIAAGTAAIIGPAVSDFQMMFDAFHEADGIVQTTRDELADVVRGLLDDADKRRSIVARGRDVIHRHQGASQRHADILAGLP